jgi:hypothetical protein
LVYLKLSELMRLKQTLLIFISLSSIVYSQTADFLIVENPSILIIYNKYQQSISNQIQKQLVSFTPFQIIEEDELLSDQISHASRVIFDNNIYFLLKNEEGNYIPDKNEYFRIFKNCELIGDTIKVLRDNWVSIFPKPEYLTRKSQHIYLDENRYCVRLFKYRNLFYLKVAGDSTVYGWTKLPRNGWELMYESDITLVTIPENLISRLKIRIDSANQDYENFFSYFNKKYDKENVIPYWNLEISDYEIQGTLNDPSLVNNLKNSNRYLIQDIDNIFLGSNFVFIFSDSSFSIKPASKRK